MAEGWKAFRESPRVESRSLAETGGLAEVAQGAGVKQACHDVLLAFFVREIVLRIHLVWCLALDVLRSSRGFVARKKVAR